MVSYVTFILSLLIPFFFGTSGRLYFVIMAFPGYFY